MLRLLALGHTNQEIAKQLYISVRTAETHRAHIMQKLRSRTRAELVRYALADGLLDDADARLDRRSVGHRPFGLPTLSSPTWPRSTCAKAWDTKG